MRHMERILVAVTAIIAIAFSSAVGWTLVGLWRHPPRLAVEPASDGLIWRGGTLAAELQVGPEGFEQLIIWRGAGDFDGIAAISAGAAP